MEKLFKFTPKSLFNIIFTGVILFTITWNAQATHTSEYRFCIPLTFHQTDTPKLKKPIIDTTQSIKRLASDTSFMDSSKQVVTDTFYLKISKDTLDAPITFNAEDSAVVLVKDKKVILYGSTKTNYKDIDLSAPFVTLNQATELITATNSKDSAGEVIDYVIFKQGEQEYQSETMQFNFRNQKGFTKNTYTQQGEFLVIGETIKKIDTSTVFVHQGRFTTCLLDEPHFAFKAEKIKLVNKKVAVTGPTHPEFEGVAVPVYLPFGFFPMKLGRKGGLIPPRLSVNDAQGVGLEGIGYYFIMNDYWDVQATGNIYSYGGWSMNIRPTYRKRYKYGGSFAFDVQQFKQGIKGDPNFNKSRNYNLNWNHSADTRSRPGVTFSANVNMSTTKYNYYVPNMAQQNFQNLQSSSIAYSKTWKDKPFNLTLSANHSQNNNLGQINFTLPDAGFTVNTIYPFQKKESIGQQKWFEKIGVGYRGSFQNSISIYDSSFRLSQLLDHFQWGARHDFPIMTSLPPILKGALVISPSISYQQVWLSQKIRKNWNVANQKVDTVITKGFFTDHSASFGIGMSTALFGTFNFKKSKVEAIRHVIRPTFSMNYKPDLSGKNYFVDTVYKGLMPEAYGQFNVPGYNFYGFSAGKNGGISFSIDNSLEMKVKNKDSANGEATKKVRLIEGFGLNSSYNFLADSMKLSPINLYFRTNLFEIINITASGLLNPYQSDSIGRDIGKYAWEGGKFSLGRISNANINIGASFQSKPKDEAKDKRQKAEVEANLDDPELRADQQRLLEYARQNPNEFVDFNIPWRLTFSYSLGMYQVRKADYSGFETKTNSGINMSGSFNLTDKWNFSVNSHYDFTTAKLQSLQIGINRDMHCWQMGISVTPVGVWRMFNFTISPKSSLLQDLKINRTRTFFN